MKICILTPRFPYPENGGDVLRINNIARYLKSRGHELILVSFCECSAGCVQKEKEDVYDYIYMTERKRFTSAVYSALNLLRGMPIQCGYYHSSNYKRLLRQVIDRHHPDMFVAHLLRMTPYLETFGVEDKSVIEMTDVLSKTYGLSSNAKGNMLKKNIYAIEKKLIARYERHVIDTFPKIVLVSPEDIAYISKATDNNIFLHTNGVSVLNDISPRYDSNKICFIGNMRTLQNQDAVLFFVNKVFPKILNKRKDAKLYIVGAQPSQMIKSLTCNNVIVTGYVEDMSSLIKDSCLAVAPVRVASGIQNKVLVAMSHRIPVILTSMISKAIPELRNGENCLIEDDANRIADKCLSLMSDTNLRETIASNGYEMVKHSYLWESKLKGYEIIPN